MEYISDLLWCFTVFAACKVKSDHAPNATYQLQLMKYETERITRKRKTSNFKTKSTLL